MIDHVSLQVRDLKTSAAFYASVLEPLGYSQLVEREATIGFGKRYPEIWLNLRADMPPALVNTGAHICLRARNEDEVRAFYDQAMAHGGADDGPPGPRQAAMTGYYACFVLDPDGNRIEAATFPAPSR